MYLLTSEDKKGWNTLGLYSTYEKAVAAIPLGDKYKVNNKSRKADTVIKTNGIIYYIEKMEVTE